MPPKPRPHGKKPPPRLKSSRKPTAGVDRRMLLIAGIGGAVAVAAVVGVLVLGGGGGDTDARAALEAAGCTLSATPALAPGDHSVTTPDGTSEKWTTDPPTSGPHYGLTVIWGVYDEPVNQGQLVHNLEHGGIFIQYGDDVPPATIEALKTFASGKPRGTVLAPYAKLGDKIALGVWVTESEQFSEGEVTGSADGTALLAKCTTFDESAFAAFFDAYQFKGPERLPADMLLPGRQ